VGVRKRAGLTRSVLIEAARRLLNEVGLDGLTVRRLAAELGVQSPALYWHIRTKQELLDGVADAIVLAAGMGPPRATETWRDWLLRRARSYRAALLEHRDGARIVANARLGPTTLQHFDNELTAMVEHGFSPVLALRTITAVTQYVNGFVLQEQTQRQEPMDTPTDPIAALAALLDGGPTATLVVAIREAGIGLRDEAFEHGLAVLMDGTTAALSRQDHPGPGQLG
jgi:TetR/AcrR family tetracycline transcriptional repressor